MLKPLRLHSSKSRLHRKMRKLLRVSEGSFSPSWLLWLMFPLHMFVQTQRYVYEDFCTSDLVYQNIHFSFEFLEILRTNDITRIELEDALAMINSRRSSEAAE
jgi:hypothetical protein